MGDFSSRAWVQGVQGGDTSAISKSIAGKSWRLYWFKGAFMGFTHLNPFGQKKTWFQEFIDPWIPSNWLFEDHHPLGSASDAGCSWLRWPFKALRSAESPLFHRGVFFFLNLFLWPKAYPPQITLPIKAQASRARLVEPTWFRKRPNSTRKANGKWLNQNSFNQHQLTIRLQSVLEILMVWWWFDLILKENHTKSAKAGPHFQLKAHLHW